MSILMQETNYQRGTGEYIKRYPTPEEEKAIRVIEANRLKAKRVSAPKQSISIDAGRMF